MFKSGSDPKVEQAARRLKEEYKNDRYKTNENTKTTTAELDLEKQYARIESIKIRLTLLLVNFVLKYSSLLELPKGLHPTS